MLIWAAKRGLKRTAWLSLAEGASIEAPHAVTMPPALGCLGFDSMTTYLTPLQIALCYGSDSVARLLIKLGAISSSFYPPELCSCTSLHMAAVMGLTSVMKILVAQGTYIDACDKQLRTPFHYAVAMQHRDSPEQGRTVMWLLANGANPVTEDIQRRRPGSIGKKHSNPFVKMLFKEGVEVAEYEAFIQDQDVLEMRRLAKEKREEEAWTKEKREKQLACKRASSAVKKRERDREMAKKKRVAAEQKVAIIRSREQEEMAKRREAYKRTQQCAKEKADKVAAAQKVVEEQEKIEKVRLERHNAIRETWSGLRKEADQRSQVTTKLDLRTQLDCSHPSGLWKSKARKTCQSCGMSVKSLSFCPDCGFVMCKQCNSRKVQT